jgi:hypothetical protein
MRKIIENSFIQGCFRYFSPRYNKSGFLLLIGKIVIVSSLGALFIYGFCGSRANNDPYPHIEIPIYSNPKTIKSYVDSFASIKSKSYKIKQAYPADKIIDFYAQAMKEVGFRPYKEAHGVQENWINFEDESKGGIRHIRQFSKAWISSDEIMEAILVLRYESLNENNWPDELFITFQIMQAFEEKPIDDFIKKLRENGKYCEFMELLKQYSTPNQDIDFENAIKENPDNGYLKEYQKIINKKAKEVTS